MPRTILIILESLLNERLSRKSHRILRHPGQCVGGGTQRTPWGSLAGVNPGEMNSTELSHWSFSSRWTLATYSQVDA